MLKDLFTQGCRGPRATHSKAQGHLNPSRLVTAYFSFIEITLRGWWSKVIPRATWNTTWAVSVRTRAPEQDLVSASSVYCSRPKPTAVKNSILPKMSSVTDTGEAQDLQGQPSKSCQHLPLWADTQEHPKLSLLCLSGGWWRHTLGPQAAPLCLPAPPFSRHRSQQLIYSDCTHTREAEGVSEEAEAPSGWALGTGQERDRAVPGAHGVPAWCIPTAACKSIFYDFHPLALITAIVVAKIK